LTSHQALFAELKESGRITSGTKWKEVYPLFAKDERYINMLGLPGSSPLELFWDIVDELDMELDHKVKGVEKLLSDKSVEVTDKTSLEELAEIIKTDELVSKVVGTGTEAVYRHVSGITQLERMSTLLSLSSTRWPSGRKPMPDDARNENNADFRKTFVMH
jgi:pre-mRNA-processing factor 40